MGIRDVLAEGEAGTAGVSPLCLPTLRPGTCVRVNTGAPVPQQAGVAVLQVEDTRVAEASADGRTELKVEMLTAVVEGHDIRRAGSDIAAGTVVVNKGAVLAAAELGLLATVGATAVRYTLASHLNFHSLNED